MKMIHHIPHTCALLTVITVSSVSYANGAPRDQRDLLGAASDEPFPGARGSSDRKTLSSEHLGTSRANTQEAWAGVGMFLLGPMLRGGYTRNLDSRFSPEVDFSWSPYSWTDEEEGGFRGYRSERLHLAAHLRFYPSRTGSFAVYGGLAHNWQIDMWEYADGSRRKHQFHTVEIEAGIGNRWIIGDGIVLGGDWIGIGGQVLELDQSGERDLAHSASAIRAASPTLHICKLNAGVRF